MELTTNTIELSSECNCVVLDDDDNEIQSQDCWGCYKESLEYLTLELGHWAKANGYNDDVIIRVQASSMTWQRISGYGDITLTDIPQFLELNGDFRIVFDLTPDYLTLTARRYSHDEPTGTGLITFTESPFSRCDYCGDPSECLIINNEKVCQHCKEWKGIN